MRSLLAALGFDDVEVLGRSEIRTRYLGLGPDAGRAARTSVRARPP